MLQVDSDGPIGVPANEETLGQLVGPLQGASRIELDQKSIVFVIGILVGLGIFIWLRGRKRKKDRTKGNDDWD